MKRIFLLLLLLSTVPIGCSRIGNSETDKFNKKMESASDSVGEEVTHAEAKVAPTQDESFSDDTSTNTIFLKFGWLQLYSSSETVKSYIGQADSCSDPIISGIDGSFVKTCFYSKWGLQIEYAADDSISAGVVSSCWIKSPSALRTKHGIRIGISRSEAKRFLGSLIRTEDDERLFIGDAYYGTVLFFVNDTLNRVFIGQLSE